MKSYSLSLMGFVFTAVFVVAQLYLLIPATALLKTVYGTSSTNISLLTSYFGFAYASGFLVWGTLSDRFGRKRILLIGLTGLTVTTAVLALYNTQYETTLILRIVQGFLASAFPPVALAYIGESFPSHLRMKGIAWMSTAFLLAALIGQWLGGRLIVESIAMSMWLFAALYLIAVFLNTLLPTQEKIGPGEQVAEHSPPRFIDVAISTLTNIQLLRLYLIALALLGSFVSLYTYLANNQDVALPAGLTVSELRIYAIPCMFAPVFVGHALRRLGAERLIFLSLLVAALCLLGHTSVTGKGLFVAIHLLFVLSIATTVPSVIALVTARSTPGNRGFAVSLYTFTLFVGASLGALVPIILGNITPYVATAAIGVAMVFNFPSTLKQANENA